MRDSALRIEKITARAFTIPTDAPESDGTIAWTSTTLVVANVEAAGACGFGFTYGSPACAQLISGALAAAIGGHDPMNVEACWRSATAAVRNVGWPGVAACAISALDIALWDLKAKLLGIPVSELLGSFRASVPVYGSGGFTSYSDRQLTRQLEGWANQGCRFVKMKVGREPERDSERVRIARETIGDRILFVDANGAYSVRQAINLAQQFARYGVEWFEEPVSSDDLDGLRFVREHVPPSMSVAAGEYGYTPTYFRTMLQAGAIDVLQADATRCGGITGFLRAAALCDAYCQPLSSHCAPSAHRDVAAAVPRIVHMEWFHDHVRIEQMLLEGAARIEGGLVAPNRSIPGNGLSLRTEAAAEFEVPQ